jgi:hypothetical protein
VPWTVYSRREATSRAARALIEDPHRSDQALAEQAQTSSTTIASVRARLEQVGVIERVPVSQRTQRPRPQRPSATRDLIEQGITSPREVARLAGVSLQAAHQMLRKLNPPLSDAAAAVDALTVVKMPRMLDECAAAADSISVRVAVTCTWCSAVFCTSTADAQGRKRRFCSDSCRDADSRERGHAPRPRKADPLHPPPQIRPLPPAPDLSAGTCAHVPPAQARWWTSSDPFLREAAANLCMTCPVLLPCSRYALALPVTDNAVWAGMSQAERLRRKRAERAAAAIPRPSPRNLR